MLRRLLLVRRRRLRVRVPRPLELPPRAPLPLLAVPVSCMEFVDLADAAPLLHALPKPVLHLKGFTNGMLLSGAPDPPSPSCFDVPAVRKLTARAVSATLAHVNALNPATLVWDGDGLKPDSFAALIPVLARRRPHMKLVSFRYAHQRQWFEASWCNAGLKLTVIIVSLPPGTLDVERSDYAKLGFEAIRDTGAETCICLGGGTVVVEEFLMTRGLMPPPRFILLDVPRWRSLSEPIGELEHSPLVGLVPSEPLL